MKARIILVTVALVLGFAAALTVVGYLNTVKLEVAGDSKPLSVLSAGTDLPKGLGLDELRSRGLVQTRKVPKHLVPAGAISPRAKLKKMVLLRNVTKGEMLNRSHFGSPKGAGLSFKTPEGLVAVGIHAENERAVGNNVEVGDFVNVVVTFVPEDAERKKAVETDTLLHKVLVLGIKETIDRPDKDDTPNLQADTGSRADQNKTVSLAMTQSDAVKLIAALEGGGKAWLTLVPSPEAPAFHAGDLAVAGQ